MCFLNRNQCALCVGTIRYINRLENHPQNIRLDHLGFLADGLEVSPSALLRESGSTKDESQFNNTGGKGFFST